MATRISTSISIGGKRTEHPPYISCAATGKANSIFCPLGPAPTMGWFCMLKRHLDELDINSAHTIVWSEQLDTGVIGGGSLRTLTFPGLYITKSERLFQGGVGDPNALHLVTFSDARYIAAKSSDTNVILSNLRSYANDAEFLTGTTTYGTWSALVEAIWDACGVLGTYPGLPSGLLIDGAPNNHWLIGFNAYRTLNAVLDQLDCALQHNPFSTNYGIVALGANQTLTSGTGDARLKWDGEPKSPKTSLADSVNVYHSSHYKSYGQERDTELADNWAYNGTGQVNAVSTGISGAASTIPLWDDLPVLLSELNTATNTSEIATRDANRAARYALRWNIDNHHRIYTGLINDFTPAGQIRAVLWRNYGDGEDNALGGTVTEYVCCADLVTGCNHSNSGGSEWAWLDGPERQQYLSPDYGRNSFPNYPRLPNIVQVWQASATASATVNPDATVEANGVKLHSGRVKRWVANGMATLDDCWILFVDDYDTNLGDVSARQGHYYGPARLSGVTTVFGTTRPVYTLTKGIAAAGQQSLYYYNYKPIQDFNTSIPITFPAVLDQTHPEGWTGAAFGVGDEEAVGIIYDNLETTPDVNGNFRVAKTGIYKIEWAGGIYVKTGVSASTNFCKLHVTCELWKKPVGGTNEWLEDVITGTPIGFGATAMLPETGDTHTIPVSNMGMFFATAGDRLSFRWQLTADPYTSSDYQATINFPFTYFTYIQEENMFADSFISL